MGKFKEGDRVKAVAPCDEQDRFIGEIGTIITVLEDSRDALPILVRFDNDVDGHGVGEHKGHEWWCEADSLELFVEEPKPTKPILIIDDTPPKEDYSNSCWYCRKGGLVDLYLNGDMGICPKCGRLCNAPPSVAPIKGFKHSKVAEPTTNEPLTTEELNALANGSKVFVVETENGVEQLHSHYTCWRTVSEGKLKRRGGFCWIDECNKSTGTSYNVYLEKPDGAVDSGS